MRNITDNKNTVTQISIESTLRRTECWTFLCVEKVAYGAYAEYSDWSHTNSKE